MELLVTVWLEWKHLADLACPCLHPRAGESPCGRCVPSCAAACRALHCSAALAGAHHQAGSGGARSRVLCGLGGWARCRMGLIAATLHLQKYRKIGCSAPLGCTTVCARGEGAEGCRAVRARCVPAAVCAPCGCISVTEGTQSPSSPEQQLWSCDPPRAGTGQPEWDGQGGCTQARRDGKLPTPSRFLPSAGQET